MNIYTQTIAEGLKIDLQSASKIQSFIECWFDDFRWGSSTKAQIVFTAKQAQMMMNDPKYADLVNYKAGA
jgi:hypothetical protein